MTIQITVRLPDAVVAFLDRSVAADQATSRAALVAHALEREMRLQAAQQDAAILHTQGAADDLDELVAWSTTRTVLED